MSCVNLTDAQKKKNIYKQTHSGRSRAMEFSHIMRNTKFDLTRKNVDCATGGTTIITEQWVQVSKLIASDLSNNDIFGRSVDIYGDYIVVGSSSEDTPPYTENGAVYVYKRNGDSYGDLSGSVYKENYKLLASDLNNNDLLGYSVAIYGDYIAAGAYLQNTTPYTNNGAVYVYKRNGDSYGVLSGSVYKENYKLIASDLNNNDFFGVSVSIYENYVVVCANSENTAPYTDNGAIYVYKKNGNGSYGVLSGSVYKENYKLLASDLNNNDGLGYPVSIYGDYILGSSSSEDTPPYTENGAVYVYKRNGDSYGDLSGSVYKENYKLLASDLSNNDRFGYSNDIYGDYIVVGALRKDTPPYTDNGAVYVYKKNGDGSYGDLSGSTYKENYKLIASDLSGGYLFGESVSIYDDYVVVGSKNNNTLPYTFNGAVYLYKRNGNGSYGDLSGSVYKENYKLLASDLNNNDFFGNSVSIYNDYIVVGAFQSDIPPYSNNGVAYVFKKQITITN